METFRTAVCKALTVQSCGSTWCRELVTQEDLTHSYNQILCSTAVKQCLEILVQASFEAAQRDPVHATNPSLKAVEITPGAAEHIQSEVHANAVTLSC